MAHKTTVTIYIVRGMNELTIFFTERRKLCWNEKYRPLFAQQMKYCAK